MASKNTSIALGPDLEAFARRKVESGEYGSISEVIRDAMRRAVERDVKLEALRAALLEGEQSGPGKPWNLEEFLTDMQERHRNAA